jgi:hypothetical protein
LMDMESRADKDGIPSLFLKDLWDVVRMWLLLYIVRVCVFVFGAD